MRDRAYEHLTEAEKRLAFRMSKHFPAVKPGHGSQHQFNLDSGGQRISGDPGNCVSKGCNPFEPKHRQDRLAAASEFVLASRF